MERSFFVQSYSLAVSNSTSSFSSVIVVRSDIADHGVRTVAEALDAVMSSRMP